MMGFDIDMFTPFLRDGAHHRLDGAHHGATRGQPSDPPRCRNITAQASGVSFQLKNVKLNFL